MLRVVAVLSGVVVAVDTVRVFVFVRAGVVVVGVEV